MNTCFAAVVLAAFASQISPYLTWPGGTLAVVAAAVALVAYFSILPAKRINPRPEPMQGERPATTQYRSREILRKTPSVEDQSVSDVHLERWLGEQHKGLFNDENFLSYLLDDNILRRSRKPNLTPLLSPHIADLEKLLNEKLLSSSGDSTSSYLMFENLHRLCHPNWFLQHSQYSALNPLLLGEPEATTAARGLSSTEAVKGGHGVEGGRLVIVLGSVRIEITEQEIHVVSSKELELRVTTPSKRPVASVLTTGEAPSRRVSRTVH